MEEILLAPKVKDRQIYKLWPHGWICCTKQVTKILDVTIKLTTTIHFGDIEILKNVHKVIQEGRERRGEKIKFTLQWKRVAKSDFQWRCMQRG